ncbi:MAG: sigma-70 region 4 domain-containing protein [Nocardioides sp.]
MIAGTGWTSSTDGDDRGCPPAVRRAALLREDVHGLSYDDIAELLGVPLDGQGADPPRAQAGPAAAAR